MVRERHPPARGPSSPVRTCLGCRDRTAKDELLRVVAGPDSDGVPAVVPDPVATAPGRGAYTHPDPECVAAAVRRRAFSRALRAGTTLATHLLEAHVAASATPTDRDESGASSS